MWLPILARGFYNYVTKYTWFYCDVTTNSCKRFYYDVTTNNCNGSYYDETKYTCKSDSMMWLRRGFIKMLL